jgi:DNA polymerase elongation subunit (family B)
LDFYCSVIQQKNSLLVSGYKDGKRVLDKVAYRPYLFVPNPKGEYRTIFGEARSKINFDSIYDAKDYIQRYENIPNFPINGMSAWPYVYIRDTYKASGAEYDFNTISRVALDIEVDTADGFSTPEDATAEVTAITISRNGNYVCLGVKEFDPAKCPYDVKYIKCDSEFQLLKRFLRLWNHEDFSPDIVTGWNIDQYDIPYLINRIARVLGLDDARRLSPHNLISSREVPTEYGTKQLWTIAGVAIYDYMQLYIKFVVPNKGRPESFALNYICQEELGEKKLDYSEYGDLDTLYKENPQLYYEYNVRDVWLVDRLEAKMNLIFLAVLMTYDAGVNMMDVFGTIRVWDALIHDYLMRKKVVVPFSKLSDLDFRIEGGYVKDPEPGEFHWVASLDLKSSYPHQIMMYNIGPETFHDIWPNVRADTFTNREVNTDEATENGKYVIAANGCRFRKDVKSFLSALMEENFAKRAVFKAQMIEAQKNAEAATDEAEKKKWKDEAAKYENMQHATKIKINAAYGALSNAYFRWFNPHFAEAITQSGQLAVKWGEKTINEYLNRLLKTESDYIIAIDTDSLYINLGPLVYSIDPSADPSKGDRRKVINMMDKICKDKILPLIRNSYQDMANYMHAPAQKMDMNRETLANKAIWTGKKHYILNMYDKEGIPYDPPKKKFVGIEAVRSSTPNAARAKIKQAIDIILDGSQQDLHSFVVEVRKDFRDNLPLDEIAFPKGANNLGKWVDAAGNFRSGTPIQVRAAINHNNLLTKHQTKRFKPIASGEKIKYVYLQKYNPENLPVVGFSDILPPEFNLDEYVDRIKQFNKGFKSPLETITNAIGWTVEPIATIDAFRVDSVPCL